MFVHDGRGIRTRTDEASSLPTALPKLPQKVRRHCRIRTGSNPTSVMNKDVNYISGIAEKMTVATITKGNA